MTHRVPRRAALWTGAAASAVFTMLVSLPAEAQSQATSTAALVEADGPTAVSTEAELREAWADPRRRRIDLTGDIYLRNCRVGDPIRESPYPMVVDGHGFALRQTCFEKRLLRQDGTGFVQLQHLGLHNGGSDGPGAAFTSRGEIKIV